MAGVGSVETTGTGRWAQAGVPHKGWHCIDIEELNEQDHICEMCEARQVRFVHVMEHPADEIFRVRLKSAGSTNSGAKDPRIPKRKRVHLHNMNTLIDFA
jgi:hypothetical protein